MDMPITTAKPRVIYLTPIFVSPLVLRDSLFPVFHIQMKLPLILDQ